MTSNRAPGTELNFCASSRQVLEAVNLDAFDAVYLGQPFCLKFAGNFLIDLPALEQAVSRIHAANKKAYLTTPAIPKGRDLPKVRKALELAARLGVDGVEVHDVGVFRMIRRDFAEVRVHVGNFANAYNQNSVALWKRLGAARVIPSHELTGPELAVLTAVEGLEFERPVHGPLPLGMAFSCTLRRKMPEGEPGPCRQQCSEEHYLGLDGWRMRSVGTSVLTGEDYCLLEHIEGLLELNISALRLETYFDQPEKIDRLGSIYRRALDSRGRAVSDKDILDVETLASKGLCNGWHFGRSGREYVSAVKAEGSAYVGEQSSPV